MAAFSDAFNANTTRNAALAVASSIVATLLGGLVFSLARGRGVPNWFMRTFMLFCLSLLLLLPLHDIQNWWQGKPFDLDSVFLYTIIVMTMTGDYQIWKNLWYFRS
jgi:drug/metabolite transporter (DMT)-like permease